MFVSMIQAVIFGQNSTYWTGLAVNSLNFFMKIKRRGEPVNVAIFWGDFRLKANRAQRNSWFSAKAIEVV